MTILKQNISFDRTTGGVPGLFLILMVFLSVSCFRNDPSLKNPYPDYSASWPANHARGFDVEVYDSFRILNVYNPWQGARDMVFTYLLADAGTDLPKIMPGHARNAPVIRVPVKSVICLSTTHVALLDFIEETGSIASVAGGGYVYNRSVRDRLKRGELPSIGYDMNLNYERILELAPDIILAYGVGAEASSWPERLRKLGITVVFIGEYLEETPLGQAEWVKFISHFFNKQELAEEKFSELENEYTKLAGIAKDPGYHPVVMSGLPWRNSWFVPGGKSLFAALIADAGGKYLWENQQGKENFPVDIERVMEQGSSADFWINTGTALSAGDILKIDTRLGRLRPFLQNNIYNNNARINDQGGNDYWESGIVNPHLILKDLISILHPDLLPGHKPVYFREL
jgi:iron complex transport system substrate-binding protein